MRFYSVEAASDFDLSAVLSSSLSFLDEEKSVGAALDSLVVLSRISQVWTGPHEDVFVKLLELYFSGRLKGQEPECCIRILANIPLQNEQLTGY